MERPSRYVLRGILALAVVWCFWTCWFVVDRDENSVVKRFGEHVRTVEPGFAFKLPYPIEDATEVAVTKVARVEVGFDSSVIDANGEELEIPHEHEMLTGDTNIVHLDFIVQYRAADAPKWLFRLREPDEAVKLLAQGAMRLVVGGHTFDDVATSGRTQIQEESEKLLQELCDKFDFGAKILAVQLQDAHPPNAVLAAFQDVNNAKEEGQKKISVAEGYQNERVPKARGEAKQIVEDSLGYRAARIQDAVGDADRFLSVYEKYRQAPELTRDRMRLEAIGDILAGKNQLIDNTGGNVLKFFDTTGKGSKQ